MSTPTPARRVAVIGGGVAGCTLAEGIQRAWPHSEVILLEGHTHLGGLSVCAQPDEIGWDRFYHVVTPQDQHLLRWLERLGLRHRVRWRSVATGFYTDGRLYSLTTSLDFLRFPPLGLLDKVRLGLTILYAARTASGADLEGITAAQWLTRLSGRRTYARIWEPLLRAKLGSAHQQVAASFIWSTIRRLYATRQGERQSESFGYISGGYAPVFETARQYLTSLGVRVRCGFPVRGAEDRGGSILLHGPEGETVEADRVIYTGPSRLLTRIFAALPLPDALRRRADSLRYLGVICMVLKLRRAVSPYYVLNITDPSVPFTGVIGLTTLVDPVEVGGHHLIYLPRYLPDDDPDFDRPDEAFYQPFMAAMRQIFARRGFVEREVELWRIFRARYVSPLHVLHYDKLMLPVELLPGRLYLVNTGRILSGTVNNSQMIEEVERALPLVLA
ncbi:MAG: FAD-dependent oxidoreductase [Myxococcales bacterium]|nr:FAD-dependent oxidoreductase [Myxococcota bacterium]MDW8283903.1 FAD-dependent oxidoreductase [Myxococcales bacterium]